MSARRRAAFLGVVVAAAVTMVPAGPAAALPFTNPAPINLPGPGPGVPGPTPSPLYPSNIMVAGLTGTITDVNVTLNGLDCSARGNDYAFPEDVDIMLVGPTGANAVVFSDVGGNNVDVPPLQFGAINITLDDQAANALPADTQLSAGTYRPFDDDDDLAEQPNSQGVDLFPVPAPAPSGNTALSTFNGTAPNGTWSLYVVDDYPGPDNCRISSGWTVDILTTAGVEPETPPPDFDGNGRTDVSVFRPANGLWYSQSPFSVMAWGAAGDIPVPGDYDGNGATEHAVYRPTTGTWYLRGPNPRSTVWGTTGDIPVPADYDGNGTTDVAVFRPSNGLWYVQSPFQVLAWGQNLDIPVPGDYDGDGKAEPAVYRPSNGTWYLRSTTPTAAVWGVAGDIPVPGDYDGNGTTDIAVFRPTGGLWYVRTPFSVISGWGQPGDIPVPGDYDGNGTTDPATYRPSNNTWYLRTPIPIVTVWGAPGDIPLPLPQAIYRRFF